MKIQSNGLLHQHVLDALTKEYIVVKPFPHLTELIYCLTRSYFDRTDPLPPTDNELLLFSVGFGLERVMITTMPIEPMVVDGINITPDFLPSYTEGGPPGELKSTRMKPPTSIETINLPESWVEQIMGYCKASKVTEYDLAVMHIIPADLKTYRLSFDQEEIDSFWTEYVLERRNYYLEAVALLQQPTAFQWCKEWECKNCRYRLRCDVQASARRHGT